jgi:hypothetical protein
MIKVDWSGYDALHLKGRVTKGGSLNLALWVIPDGTTLITISNWTRNRIHQIHNYGKANGYH